MQKRHQPVATGVVVHEKLRTFLCQAFARHAISWARLSGIHSCRKSLSVVAPGMRGAS